MFPLWDLAIAPVLEASKAKRVLEIGALRGDTTIRMLERLGPDAELHVIDPVPSFDPSEHERQFPGRYLFYRDTSHNVLPTLPAMDVALIDGDHNWYTVYNELKMLSAAAAASDSLLPVLILHDVGWPYGRRDLYYAPDRIPEEFRQEYAQAGMVMGKERLVLAGGLNPTMNNAVREGGERNGVMTALEDFLDELGAAVRMVVLPIYFGLAIVAEEERLSRQPELEGVLNWLESKDGRGKLLELAEDVRLRAMLTQHNVYFNAEKRHDRAARRYLNLLKGALLDEHYFENELRIHHLQRSLATGVAPQERGLRDPVRQLPERTRRLLAARRAGKLGAEEDAADYFPYTNMGRRRLDFIHESLDAIRTEDVKGDLVECGTGRGGGAMFLRGYVSIYGMVNRDVWIADEFRASPRKSESEQAIQPDGAQPPVGGGDGFPELLPDLNTVREGFHRFDLLDNRVHFLIGPPRHTLPGGVEKIALLRLGPLDQEDLEASLEELYDRITLGGFLVVDGCDDPRRRQVVDEFRARRGIPEPVQRVDWAAVAWRKVEERPATAKVRNETQVAGAPLLREVPGSPCDLSVVVVLYNMRREAERTLHSISRSYQQEIDDLDYEVIVVDNGSEPDQKLSEEAVSSFGPEFRWLDLADEATPSPVHALNRGLQVARGRFLAMMIDGAHVLTPGVLKYGMLGLQTYEPAVVATQQWYVGPAQQPDAVTEGYDQDYEDRLFAEIGWPVDGYRLFDVGHFIGDRDWLDGLWESNCIFVPRSMLEQVGCFDESFSMPGGGFANLEFYERVGASPDVKFVTILGEGSFHQVHGGTTTNLPDVAERHRLLASYAQHYAENRGRGYIGHRRRIHYVGTMIDEARRTRARRRVSPNHFKTAAKRDIDGMPTEPSPMPQDLRTEFIDAYWRTLAWRKTRWLGTRVHKTPFDLIKYQELVYDLRPDWIIETGSGGGGRAYFLASICDMIDHGQVVSIDGKEIEGRPIHDRIAYVTGITWHPDTVTRVREIVSDTRNALVILGSRGSAKRTIEEFRAYSPFVPVGGYLIVEETIVGGHPVWGDFGPGPAEGIRSIVEARGDFASDLDIEKHSVTFNPGGFLKRLS